MRPIFHVGQYTIYQLLEKTVNTCMLVGRVFRKQGQHAWPLCYVYCLYRARHGQNVMEVSHGHLAYLLVKVTIFKITGTELTRIGFGYLTMRSGGW